MQIELKKEYLIQYNRASKTAGGFKNLNVASREARDIEIIHHILID